MGYEMIQFFENVKLSKKNTMDLPDSIFLRPSVTLVFDNVNDKIIISQLVSKEINKNAEQMFKSIKKSIYDIKKNICKPIKKKYFEIFQEKKYFEEKKSNISVDIFKNVETNPSFENFKYMIKRAKKYIQEGEIFQVVLSRLFKKKIKVSPISIYRALRYLNPSPYLFFMNFKNFFNCWFKSRNFN